MDFDSLPGGEMRTDAEYRDYVASQLRDHGGRLVTIEEQLNSVQLRGDEIYELLLLARGFFKFCILLGKVAKWVAGLATAALAVWKLAEHFTKTHWPWS